MTRLYKVCYTIGYKRREILCADYITALRLRIMLGKLSIQCGPYHSPRMYSLIEKGWNECEEG